MKQPVEPTILHARAASQIHKARAIPGVANGVEMRVAKFEMTRGRKLWAERGARYYTAGLNRLAGKPSGNGDGARFADDAHPYAADLDLFGPGSVYERVTESSLVLVASYAVVVA